jgi:CcmD family protein
VRTLVVAAWLFAASWGRAQQADGGDRATSFERAEGPTRERLPGGTLLVVAYAIFWVATLGFVVLQKRRIARLEEEVDRLTRALKEPPKL